jgi:hypothetical protein
MITILLTIPCFHLLLPANLSTNLPITNVEQDGCRHLNTRGCAGIAFHKPDDVSSQDDVILVCKEFRVFLLNAQE